jgi:anthranilate phosphoribosyltransferase
MKQIMAGETTPSQIGAFLTSLRMKGESAEEIAGCAQAMRAHALKVETRQEEFIDTCGTGGDGLGTFNISTIVAFVVAGAGLSVAKHGNRSVSSRCGSADLLEALGARIDLGPEEVARCIDEVGFGFLFAQRLHPAMRNVAAPRKEIGIRTLFNLLGPLTNPASAPIQLMGVYSPALTETIAHVLGLLGTRHAMVVHSSEGLDELSLSQNKVTQLVGTAIKTFSLTPEEVGLPRADLKELQGGTPTENAAVAWSLLKGEKGTKRDIVLLNAAAALVIAGKADSFTSGVELAAEAINSGKALDKLERFIALTQKLT